MLPVLCQLKNNLKAYEKFIQRSSEKMIPLTKNQMVSLLYLCYKMPKTRKQQFFEILSSVNENLFDDSTVWKSLMKQIQC